MAQEQSSRLARAIYRALLKWGRSNEGVPLPLKSADVYAAAPELRACAELDLQDASAAVRAAARKAFASRRLLQGEEASAALEAGLAALRCLNTEYAASVALMRATRADKADREGVRFELGTVFLHKKYGYRGVVYGWDRQCERDADWVREAGVEPDQPFYHVLPDEIDTTRLFSQPLSSRYVAQNNMMPLPGERIVHRAVNHFFVHHSPALGRYVPVPKLQFEYPGKYSADDGESLEADSNLLLHSEDSEGEAEGEVSGGGDGAEGGGGQRRAGRRGSAYKPVRRWGEQEAAAF